MGAKLYANCMQRTATPEPERHTFGWQCVWAVKLVPLGTSPVQIFKNGGPDF